MSASAVQSPTEEEVKQVMENNTGSPDAPSDFSLEKLRSSFEGCISEDGKILLKNYITGFEELYKFLNLLGTVFGWVSTDVDNKIGKVTYVTVNINVLWCVLKHCSLMEFYYKVPKYCFRDSTSTQERRTGK